MSLLSRSSRRQLTDATFGLLTLGKSGWTGEAPWPGGGKILVSLERGEDGPLEGDRAVFKALIDNYSAIAPHLQQALFALWEPHLRDPFWEQSWPTTPKALWQMLELSSLAIGAKGKVHLLFAFGGEVWPDAMFTVEVEGTQVTPLSLDD
jgi:hypothetical protein